MFSNVLSNSSASWSVSDYGGLTTYRAVDRLHTGISPASSSCLELHNSSSSLLVCAAELLTGQAASGCELSLTFGTDNLNARTADSESLSSNIKNQKLTIINRQSSIKLLAHDVEAGADHRSLAERVVNRFY